MLRQARALLFFVCAVATLHAESHYSNNNTTYHTTLRLLDTVPVLSTKTVIQPLSETATPDSVLSPVSVEGYKTISIQTGSNGGVLLQQEMDLRIQGKVSKNLSIESKLHDRNVPIQAQGNTSSLDEVDNIYVKLYGNSYSALFGDFLVKHIQNKFTAITHKSRGVDLLLKTKHIDNHFSYGSSRTQFHRTTFNGVEGIQSGYQLYAKSGAITSVVPGSEKVWLNGTLLNRNSEYTIEYGNGIIHFIGHEIISPDDIITLEYEYLESLQNTEALAHSFKTHTPYLTLTASYIQKAYSENTISFDSSEALPADTLPNIQDSTPEITKHKLMGGAADVTLLNRIYLHNEFSYSHIDSNQWSTNSLETGFLYNLFYTTDSTIRHTHSPLRLSYRGFYNSSDYQNFSSLQEKHTFRESWALATPTGSFKSNAIMTDYFLSQWSALHAGWKYAETFDSPSNSEVYSLAVDHLSQTAQLSASYDYTAANGATINANQGTYSQITRNRVLLAGAYRKYILHPFIKSEFNNQHNATGYQFQKRMLLTGLLLELERISLHSSWNVNTILQKQVHEQSLRDSLLTHEMVHELDYAPNNYLQGTALVQYRSVERGTNSHSDFWLTESKNHFGNSATGLEGTLTYQLSSGRDRSWVPYYEKVPAGTGTITYDEKSLEFIHNVDGGDYIIRGDIRDTVERQSLFSQSTMIESTLRPGLWINTGFLRDISLRATALWEISDSAQQTYLPTFSLNDITNQGVEGRRDFTFGSIWTYPNYYYQIRYDYSNKFQQELNSQFAQFTNTTTSKTQSYISSHTFHGFSHLFLSLWVYPSITHSTRDRYNATLSEATPLYTLTRDDYTTELQYKITRNLTPALGYSYSSSNGLYSNSQSSTTMKSILYRCRYTPRPKLFLEFSGNSVLTENKLQSDFGSYWTDSYQPGWTHRLSTTVRINVQQYLDLTFNHLYRIEPGKDFQSLYAQAKAVF